MTKKKKIIGLTGGIASGKKTASKIFKSLGAAVINADEVYEYLTKPGSVLNTKIAKAFGNKVLNKNLSLNRKVLADMVFNVVDRHACPLREKLNKITHPEIIKEIKKRIKAAKSNLIILAAPLLIEAKQTGLVDEIWLISCDKEMQINRLMKRNKISRKEALGRIKSQMSLAKKKKFADVVINNNGTIKELRGQILKNLPGNSKSKTQMTNESLNDKSENKGI